MGGTLPPSLSPHRHPNLSKMHDFVTSGRLWSRRRRSWNSTMNMRSRIERVPKTQRPRWPLRARSPAAATAARATVTGWSRRRSALTHEGQSHEAELINVSGGGAMIAATFEPNVWDKLELHLGENGTIECAVRWVKRRAHGPGIRARNPARLLGRRTGHSPSGGHQPHLRRRPFRPAAGDREAGGGRSGRRTKPPRQTPPADLVRSSALQRQAHPGPDPQHLRDRRDGSMHCSTPLRGRGRAGARRTA